MNWLTDADPYLPPPSDYMEVRRADESKNPEELRRFSESKDPNVRARVAANSNTPQDVLLKFKNDTEFVRIYLLQNRTITTDIIKTLINKEDKLFKTQAYTRLLTNYKFGLTDLTGKDLYDIVSTLAPKEGNLTVAELIEDIRSTREAELSKKL